MVVKILSVSQQET